MPKVVDYANYIGATSEVPDGFDLTTGGTIDLATAGFVLFGNRVSQFDYDPSPQTETKNWITNANETEEIESYKPTFSGNGENDGSDLGLNVVVDISKNRETRDKAKRPFIRVDKSKQTGETYAAEFFYCAWTASFTGEGTKVETVDFEGYSTTDPLKGTYNPTTETFTTVVTP